MDMRKILHVCCCKNHEVNSPVIDEEMGKKEDDAEIVESGTDKGKDKMIEKGDLANEETKVAAVPQYLVQSNGASTSTPITDCIMEDNQLRYNNKSDEEDIGFLLGCAKRGEQRGYQHPPTICKVSRVLRDLSESSFNPQLVSIGPVHREDPKLKEFEWLKECYLGGLLLKHSDSSPPNGTLLEKCLREVNNLIPRIRQSYDAGMIKYYSDSELARMMVMDGCFILEFCFKHEDEDLNLPNKMQKSRIAMDLMLLENQVPFFVLQTLLDCSRGKDTFFSLSTILDLYLARYINLFNTQLQEIFTIDSDSSHSTHDHILGYLHKRYQLVGAQTLNHTIKSIEESIVEHTYTATHSIVELDRSGVNFKPHQRFDWSMTIKFQASPLACLPWFWSKPTLLMPTLVIHDFTEVILRNLIAYEQSFPQDRYYFTSYAHVMDTLIDTQDDIAKLVESKVLVNTLSSNQEAADMINKICKNSFLTDFYYTEMFSQMDKYYNSYWPKHIAWLRGIYFKIHGISLHYLLQSFCFLLQWFRLFLPSRLHTSILALSVLV